LSDLHKSRALRSDAVVWASGRTDAAGARPPGRAARHALRNASSRCGAPSSARVAL